MTYTLHDIAGLLLAVAVFIPLLLLPGLAIAHAFNAFAFRRLPATARYGVALLTGTAALPIVASLLSRLIGLDAAVAVNLALALYGLAIVWTSGVPALSRGALLGGTAWLALLIVAWVDFDTGDALYPSLLTVDIVKHAATVRALVETGTAPPIDPFFLRESHAGYYYYYYVLSAAAERLGGGWIDPRAAVGGQVFWTGLALVSLVGLLLRKARFRVRPRLPLLIALMAAAGLQILTAIGIGLREHLWFAQINWWSDEQVTSWPMSVLWVPHHIAGFIACWTGFLLLAQLVARRQLMSRDVPAVALAGIAFASAAGLSVWVTACAVVTVGAWVTMLAFARRWSAVTVIACAGALSFLLFLPDMIDILRNRTGGALPVAFAVRSFPVVDNLVEPGLARDLARLAVLPLAYAIEFGVFLLGAYLFWHQRETLGASRSNVARLLTISAIAGLVVATFFRSTVANNDLGWRAFLFAQMAMLLWTAVAFSHAAKSWSSLRKHVGFAPAPVAAILLAFGYCGVIYDLVGLRAFQPLGLQSAGAERSNPAINRAMRTTYEWLAANTSRQFIVQHNPDVLRAFAYGLYGRGRVAVSDHHNGVLFGASETDVARRLRQMIPVFSAGLTGEEAQKRLAGSGVAAVIITPDDPVWHDKTSWVWSQAPVFTSDQVRVVAVQEPHS